LNQWIFGNMLESLPRQPERSPNLFAMSAGTADPVAAGGLLVSPSPRKSIPIDNVVAAGISSPGLAHNSITQTLDLDWLSRPLTGTTLALAIDTLIVFAAMLLFFLVFFSVSSEMPEWPLNIGLGFATAIFVAAFYWGFFHTLAGTTLGSSLARLADSDFSGKEESAKPARFR
jgi:hypothetical protein